MSLDLDLNIYSVILSPRFFAKKKSQILHPKCEILQAEKANFAKNLQCFYTA